MKKILLLILAMILSLSMLASCSFIEGLTGNEPEACDHIDADDDELCDYCGDSYFDGNDITDDEEEEKPEDEEEEKPSDKTPEDEEDKSSKSYTSFTPTEKNLFTDLIGEVIPFIANDEYYVEEYTLEYDDCYEAGINFYTYGNTEAEFKEYLKLFSKYESDGTEEDEYGDTWYYFSTEDGLYIDISYYLDEGEYIVDVYAYCLFDYEEGGNGDNGGNGGNGDNGGNGGNGGNGDTGDGSSYLYEDFTSSEKALFIEYFGEVIPFLINNKYYVEEYALDYDDGSYEEGINFYTIGNTEAQFSLYRALFSDYTDDGKEQDEYGDYWYYYTADAGYFVDMSYYYGEDEHGNSGYIVDVYVYFYDEGDGGNSGNSGNGGTTTTPGTVITNEGAGLPKGTGGVYNVDLTKAEYVKNVTDQGYYIDGCPTTGSPAVLVIPISFKDSSAISRGYSIENIVRAFTGGSGETDYYSVHDYYYISSYGQLDLDITVVNEWFVPSNTSSYYRNATYDYYGDDVAIGDQLVLNEALAYLSTFMDLSSFDTDNNGIIDAVVMINSLDIGDTDFDWAYRYWNIYTDDEGYYYEYDGVSANDYIWMPYSFLHEKTDSMGNTTYTDTSVLNTYTCIHEFAHILGADDYYDTSYSDNHPLLEGYDIMDMMIGDHNAFTKFNLGWITTSRLVTTDSSVTLTLEAFAKNGDTIIIANNWDESLGAYQEYYILVYYTNEGLNSGEGGYFIKEGILVYHVNASLIADDSDGDIYYDIYNNNTDGSDYYGTEDNLIELVKSSGGSYVYTQGSKLPSVTDDQGNKLGYSFTVDQLTDGQATITFTKN